ncbi:MAG: helix-turn-helix transcriptional regulator [Phycisphaerae bacterium]
MVKITKTQIALGRAVRKLREQAGLSQEKFAIRAHLNRSYIGDVERGARNVSLATMERLANALGKRISDLVREMERDAGGGR